MNTDTDPKMLEYMIEKYHMRRTGTVDEVASLSHGYALGRLASILSYF